MISDLSYIPDYLSAPQEQDLINTIDQQFWMTPFNRRVQHYGYIYDYKKRIVTKDMFIGKLPDWLMVIARQVTSEGHIDSAPDQVIINEYHPGQGIALHVDCEPCFGDTILSISLGSQCVMDFHHLHSENRHHQVLEPRSLVVMKREARYDWQHGIATRKSDLIHGVRVKRQRRISLTFRKVVLDHSK